MAQETQYCSLRYILGTVYSWKTEASEISPRRGERADGQQSLAEGERTRQLAGGSRERTDGSGLNHVADGEALDGLILGRASRAVAAADGLDVAAALLVAAVVLSLLDHDDGVLWQDRLC